MIVRLTQIDGDLPNIALMRLAAWHRSQGDEVQWRHGVPLRRSSAVPASSAARVRKTPKRADDRYDYSRQADEPSSYDVVYASAIFDTSAERVADFMVQWPDAVVGGSCRAANGDLRVEDIVPTQFQELDYGGYPDFTASIGYAMRGCRYRCKFCLTPDTQIMTADGLKPIAEIAVGELVLTHEGRYRRVTDLITNHYDGPIHRLRSNSLANMYPVWATPEHPTYTRHMGSTSKGLVPTAFDWKDVGDIRASDTRRVHYRYAYPRTVETVDIKTCPGADWLPVSEDLMAVIGWYLADGSIGSAKGRDKFMLVFYPGNGEKGEADAYRIAAHMEACGMKASVFSPPSGDQFRTQYYGVRFCRWLVAQFGSLSHGKKIPLWVRQLPQSYLMPLLDAYASGDGSRNIHHKSHRLRLTSVSPQMALAWREIGMKCGYAVSTYPHKSSDMIQGRKVTSRPATAVTLTVPQPNSSSICRDDRYFYSAIKEHETKHYVGTVHNLEVEDDHSYCTAAFALHNCVVPILEGPARSNSTIARIWRGPGHPKRIALLDNDFFGNPEWRAVADEVVEGGYEVCINQGINVRALAGRPKVAGVLGRLRRGQATAEDHAAIASAERLADEQCEALARMRPRNFRFSRPTLYCAWDNLGDEEVFFEGVARLVKHGFRPSWLTAYMLIGYDQKETWDRIMHRYGRMNEAGIRVYPMVFGGDANRPRPAEWDRLKQFQAWVITGARATSSFEDFNRSHKPRRDDSDQLRLFEEAA